MSDQGKWFKLWCSSLRDDDLENLSIHEWFAWARFGVHVKENGKDGKIRLRAPATAVVNLLRVPNFDEAVSMIKRFPNYEVERASDVTVQVTDTFAVKCKNWNKYQGDWSRDRVRKHRKAVTSNVTAQEEKRREETRREEINTTPIVPKGTDKVREWFEKTWQAYPKERRFGKKAAFRSYQKAVKTLEEAKEVARALENYLQSKTVKDGFIRNASTFFANWEEHKNDDRRSSQGVHGTPDGLPQNSGNAGAGIAPATDAMLHRLADSKRFPG